METYLEWGFIRWVRRNGFKILIFVCFLLILLAICLLGLYFYHFNGSFSKDSNDWSNFGQYISGVFSIVLSLMNLVILIYVAYKGSKSEQHRWETDLRNVNFKDLLKELGKVNQNTNSGIPIKNLKDYLEITDLNNYYYLGGTEEETLNILQLRMIKSLDSVFKSINFGDITDSNSGTFEDHKEYFLALKSDLIKLLGGKIMNRHILVNSVVRKYANEVAPN